MYTYTHMYRLQMGAGEPATPSSSSRQLYIYIGCNQGAPCFQPATLRAPACHPMYLMCISYVSAMHLMCISCASQVAIDEFVFDPIFVGTFFVTTGATLQPPCNRHATAMHLEPSLQLCANAAAGVVERQHWRRETLPSLRRRYWPTLKGALLASALFTPVLLVTHRALTAHPPRSHHALTTLSPRSHLTTHLSRRRCSSSPSATSPCARGFSSSTPVTSSGTPQCLRAGMAKAAPTAGAAGTGTLPLTHGGGAGGTFR